MVLGESSRHCSTKYSTTFGGLLANCTGLHLQRVPRLNAGIVALDLSENSLTLQNNDFNYSSLAYLDLSYSGLSLLPEDVFMDCPQLRHLNLSRNKLRYHNASFPRNVFKHLKSLTTLNMAFNDDSETGQYPDEIFQTLVSLRELTIDSFRETNFSSGFGAMRNLRVLNLSGSSSYCNIEILYNDSLAVFNSSVLSTLDLSYCGCVKQIHANALAPLRHLKNLNLENSPFGLHNSLKALYGLRGANMTSLNLKHVDVDSVKITKRLPDEQLFAEHLRYLKTICVSEFNMAENHIIYIHLESLFNKNNNFARCLKRLDFHENALYGNYGEFILIPIIMNNIEYIDISRFSSYCGTTTKTTLKSLFWDIKFNILPRKLKTLIIDAASKDIMAGGNYHVDGPNVLETLSASDFDTVSLEGQLTGLNNLKTLKLSHNNKMELSASFFDTFPSLENLHLNDVSLAQNYFCQNGLRLFSNLTNLKHLDLSGNGIRCLPMGIFENNHRLHTLILSNNKFRTIPFSIHDSPSLLTLVVARNEIEFLDVSFGPIGKPIYLCMQRESSFYILDSNE